MSDGPRTWPKAALDLARRVERRDRAGALLSPLSIGMLASAVAVLIGKAVGAPSTWMPLLLATGPIVGLLLGVRRMRRIPAIEMADAAWALDRLAGAKERGLVAATVEGPAAGEAAWGPGRLEPPRVRLHPPRGLALGLSAVLLLAVAALAPQRSPAPPNPEGDAPRRAKATAAATAASQAEAEAGADEARARKGEAEAEAAGAIREALGLGPSGARDPGRLAERLQDPSLLAEAQAAAAPGTHLAEVLTSPGMAPEDLAAALAAGEDAAQDARDARRRAVARRAGGALAPIPPERRAFLERYFQSLSVPQAPGVR